MRRIELLSEDPITQVSPSAGCVLKFPPPGARSRAQGIGSFIIPASPQSFGAPVPHINDAGDSSRERLRPTGGIKPRKQIRWCQLILIFRLLRGRKTRLASHAPGNPRRNQYTPVLFIVLPDCPRNLPLAVPVCHGIPFVMQVFADTDPQVELHTAVFEVNIQRNQGIPLLLGH